MIISRGGREPICIKGLSSDTADVAQFTADIAAVKKYPGFRISEYSTVRMKANMIYLYQMCSSRHMFVSW